MTLAEFLLARIAEDEEWIRKVYGIVGSDPAHVLAECDAKRRIVEKFAPVVADGGDGEYRLRQVFEFLALPYIDHPDYREEWKP